MTEFNAFGHKNMLGTHLTTLEFTKDIHLTTKGDCIIGVNSNFSLDELKKLKGKVRIVLCVKDDNEKSTDEFTAEINPDFNHETEMVIRTSDFKDRRTFAINATKAARDIKREIIAKMKDADEVMVISIDEVKRK